MNPTDLLHDANGLVNYVERQEDRGFNEQHLVMANLAQTKALIAIGLLLSKQDSDEKES